MQFVSLERDLLDTNNCYLVDNGLEVYVGIGTNSPFEERKSAYKTAEDVLRSFRRPESKIIRVIEGFVRIRFRFKFDTWLALTDVVVPEDSKEKVSGVDVKGLLKAPLSKEDAKASIDCTKFLLVWRLDGDTKSPVKGSEVSKFYGGDCYIFIYSYPGQLGEEHIVGTWFGHQSLKNKYGALHGGVEASVAELVAVACAKTVMGNEKDLLLGELSNSYLSSAQSNTEVIVEASIVRTGRNLTVVSVEFRMKESDKLVYTSRATFYNIPLASL